MALDFQGMADLHADEAQRARIHMCVRQQGAHYAADGRPDIAALGRGVVAGDWGDIDALIVAVVTGPNGHLVEQELELLAAVQGAWPLVAKARYDSDGDVRGRTRR